jgi:hypothetical protein
VLLAATDPVAFGLLGVIVALGLALISVAFAAIFATWQERRNAAIKRSVMSDRSLADALDEWERRKSARALPVVYRVPDPPVEFLDRGEDTEVKCPCSLCTEPTKAAPAPALPSFARLTCGFIPPVGGYAPCCRDKNHDGPCAHERRP